MQEEEVLAEFRSCQALLEGHFLLSSGRHSGHYLQCARVLMVEDVVTTGLSSREAIVAIEATGAKVIAAAALVDRSAGAVELGVPFTPLIALNFPTYAPEDVPTDLAKTTAIKPGSRAA